MRKVYGVALSPFVRKVLVALEVRELAYTQDPVPPQSPEPRFRRLSPLGKIPAFEDDYVQLADSSVICAYLEERYPRPSLMPTSLEDRARARWFEEYADTRLQALLGPSLFFERLVRPGLLGQPTNEALVARTIDRELPPEQDYLERRVPTTGFLFADGLGLADVSIASVFLNAHYADYAVDPDRWPRLAAYLDRVWAHPALKRRRADEAPLVDHLHTARRD